jgi:hypothetical protein
MNMANKVKVFVWQFAHNSLPVKRNIAKRGVKLDTLCPMCQRFDEDIGHLFFKCKQMRLCWLLLNLDEVRGKLLSLCSIREILEKIWDLDCDKQHMIFLLLRCWWSARNKVNAGERRKSAQEVVNDVFYHLNAWNLAHNKNDPINKQSTIPRWKVYLLTDFIR